MDKKYEICTDNKREFYYFSENMTESILSMCTLYRIRALKDFGDVKAGDLGGWIRSENNLSQYGNCWIYDTSLVIDNALICDNAKICDDSIVRGNSKICNNTIVDNNSAIWHNSCIMNNAKISNSVVKQNALIKDNASIRDSYIFDFSIVSGDAIITGPIFIRDDVIVEGNSKIISTGESIDLKGHASFPNYALINSEQDYFIFGPIGSRKDFITFYKGQDNKIYAATGCFTGDLNKLKEQVENTHGDNRYGNEYFQVIEFAKSWFSK